MRSVTGAAFVGSLLFVACASASADQSVLPDPLAAGWKGNPVCEKLLENPKQRMLRCSFPPGVGHERHFHRPNFGYVIAGGRMRITDANGTTEKDLVPGTASESPGVEWHEVINVGTTTVVYLIVEPK